MKYLQQLKQCKNASMSLAILSSEQKNDILREVAKQVEKNKQKIFLSNEADIKECSKDEAFLDRLRLDDDRIDSMVKGVLEIASLNDPVGKILERRTTNGLDLQKMAVPLGVILIIYEARPNVTLEAFSLAFKSGNAVVLKGGSEAMKTNEIIVQLIKVVLKKHGLDDALVFVDSTDHDVVKNLLKMNEFISVVIPRGGKQLVQLVQRESTIPVLSHADGIDHIYVDKSADLNMAINIIVDAKTDRPATCNTVDTVLVHGGIETKFLSKLLSELEKRGVEICEEYGKEFLGLKIAIKTVMDMDEAIEHVSTYGSKHTEGIIASDKKTIDKYVQSIDAAAVMVNCSTRLHDGGVFGLGAEMGIATGKLHARGPVGLKELTTYKWVAYGSGQTRGAS